jgi:hypothetical protein
MSDRYCRKSFKNIFCNTSVRRFDEICENSKELSARDKRELVNKV